MIYPISYLDKIQEVLADFQKETDSIVGFGIDSEGQIQFRTLEHNNKYALITMRNEGKILFEMKSKNPNPANLRDEDRVAITIMWQTYFVGEEPEYILRDLIKIYDPRDERWGKN